MTEPDARPDGPDERAADRHAASPPESASTNDAFFGARPEPTDDTPTVISRNPPPPLSADEAVAGVLRGRKLAHYELLEPIGVGGMAAVIRARDTQLDRTVALKILPPEMAADPENVRRFHQEAKAAARLDHDNVARAFFCGEDQGLHFIAYEFVEGENLRSLLEKRGRLHTNEAIGYTLQVATGLAHAASRGVVHRDIKPSNILITPSGRAKLVDMGLARSIHQDDGLTQSGVTLGTFDYISPEQALEPREADIRSDIYSLGCTLYHMLTGVPPVPDGTPAKKLHHHQHVPPVDPRQLNPDIPDDVAAVLSRMMAKEAKDRYQHPDQLVQHLTLLAHKYGAADNLPELPRFVEPPLPGPPRARPFVLAVLAVVALVLLVWLSSLPDSRSRIKDSGLAGQVASGQQPELAKATTPSESSAATAPPVGPPAPTRTLRKTPRRTEQTVSTLRELLDFLEEERPRHEPVIIRLAADLTLSRDELLELAGYDDLTIEPAEATGLRTLHLKHDSGFGIEPWAAVKVESGKVRLRRLRIEIDAASAADAVMSGVRHLGGQLFLEQCEFVQLNSPEGTGPGSLTSITVAGTPGAERSPQLSVTECWFAGGRQAVAVAGARVQLTNCALSPYAIFFPISGEGTADRTELELTSCSVMLPENGIVFRLADGAVCQVTARQCVFSRPDGPWDEPTGGVLVQETGPLLGRFRYEGERNAFHNLRTFWQRSDSHDLIALGWDDFRQRPNRDQSSETLTVSPWKAERPLELLPREPRRAFALREDLPELRQLVDERHPIGVTRCSWGPLYAGPFPPVVRPERPPTVVLPKEKVVDPDLEGSSGDGLYKTLALAVGDAKPGDVIVLRHNGLLPVKPVRLEESTIDLTIKAAAGYRPVLTLGETADPDAALFRVHDGQLRLENLTFYFPTPRDEFRTQSVVNVLGDGQCVFRDCAVTLEESDRTPMSLVTIADPNAVMRMGPPAKSQPPRVRLEGCFVRGAGDLITVRPSRPFELRVDESLVVLHGSFLIVDGASREPPSSGPSLVSLRKVTTYLTDHLLWLRSGREDGRLGRLVPTRVIGPERCLFVSADGRSLVHFDGTDRLESDDQIRRLFEWGDGRNNAYSNFAQLIDQQPREPESMGMLPYDKDRWQGFAAEYDGRYETARFVARPAEGQLARVVPGDLKVRSDSELAGYGADTDRLPLPAPHGF